MSTFRFAAVLVLVTAASASAQKLSTKTAVFAQPIAYSPISLVPDSTCWDADQDTVCDLGEDYNGDGSCDWTDCHDEFLDWMATGACANMGADARCDTATVRFTKYSYATLLLTTADVQGAGAAVDLALLGIRNLYGQSVPVYDHSVESIQMRTWGADVLSLSYDLAEQALAQALKTALATPVQTEVHVQCFTTSTGVAVQVLGPNGTMTTQATSQSLIQDPAPLMNWIAVAVDLVH